MISGSWVSLFNNYQSNYAKLFFQRNHLMHFCLNRNGLSNQGGFDLFKQAIIKHDKIKIVVEYKYFKFLSK